MENALTQFGEWLVPEGPVKGAIIFYPPATGDKGHQRAEALSLRARGFASLLYHPPYRRETRGGIGAPEVERGLWRKAREEFPRLAAAIRDHLQNSLLDIHVIGKNLGGSVAAYAIDSTVASLTISGAVPILSEFWATSAHPAAAQSRAKHSPAQIANFASAMREFDLLETAQNVKVPLLVQFGRQDEWIEKPASERFSSRVAKASVFWMDDDHVMAGAEATAQRRSFLQHNLRRRR